MKQNIFNTIQRGLNNLVIDDNDSSIKYKKADVDSNVKNLSIDQLYSLFEADKDAIFGVDTSKCITFIKYDDTEYSLHNHEKGGPSLFLKIFNDELIDAGNEILISLTSGYYGMTTGLWSNLYDEPLKSVERTMCAYDLDGYKNSMDLSNKTDNYAVNYCTHKTIMPTYNNCKSKYQGYLPAIGQLMFMIKYHEMINYILLKECGHTIPLDAGQWWSSTETSNIKQVYLLFNGQLNTLFKTTRCCILPLFKKVR